MSFGKLILGLVGVAVVNEMTKERKPQARPMRVYRKTGAVNQSLVDQLTPEDQLPDYIFSDPRKLNKYEKEYYRYFRKVRAMYPDDYKFIIKQKPPQNINGVTVNAYVYKSGPKEVTLTFPKVNSKKKQMMAVHETCHVHLGHHDKQFAGGKLDAYTKELEVEICSRNWDQGKWRYGRSISDIYNNYYQD